MFDQLVESRPHRDRSIAQVFSSIAVHTVIIAVSVQLTRAVASTVTKLPREAELFVTPSHTPKPPGAAAAARTPSLIPVPALVVPSAPVVVPIEIPPADLTRDFDPHRIGEPSHGLRVIGTELWPDSARALPLAEVDEPVEYLDGPLPRYPTALHHVAVEGWVQLRYIVAIDGTAEPRSIEVVKSSNVSFEAPAIEAIRGAHFRAARIKGRKVRQVVEQMVRFTLH